MICLSSIERLQFEQNIRKKWFMNYLLIEREKPIFLLEILIKVLNLLVSTKSQSNIPTPIKLQKKNFILPFHNHIFTIQTKSNTI